MRLRCRFSGSTTSASSLARPDMTLRAISSDSAGTGKGRTPTFFSSAGLGNSSVDPGEVRSPSTQTSSPTPTIVFLNPAAWRFHPASDFSRR